MRRTSFLITPAQRALAAGSDMFVGIPRQQVESVLGEAEGRRTKTKQLLFVEGDEIDGLHLVLGGQVKLTKLNPAGKEVIVSVAGPGEPLAAIATLPGPRHFPISCQALTQTATLFWARPQAIEMVKGEPLLQRNLHGITSGRTFQVMESLRDIATERVPSRLAAAILRLARRQPKQADGSVQLDFPLTRQELAEMIGATLFTVSRQLSEWNEEGLVVDGAPGLKVLRPGDLGVLAGIEWEAWERAAG